MKLVSAIIPAEELGSVRTSLRAFGFDQLTVAHVVQLTEDGAVYRGRRIRARLDIVVDDLDAHDILRVITATVRGAATAWITNADRCVSIRTGLASW
jgi:nitrogen regulatory protein PII